MAERRLEGEPFNYYQLLAKKIIQEEATTMYVDFEHITKFNHSDPRFIQTIVTKFYMHEPDLKAALGKFMVTMGLNGDKKKTLF